MKSMGLSIMAGIALAFLVSCGSSEGVSAVTAKKESGKDATAFATGPETPDMTPVYGIYSGIMQSEFGLIDITPRFAPAQRVVGPHQTLQKVMIEIAPPLQSLHDGAESNPFFLYIESFPKGVGLQPGQILLTSATLESNTNPIGPTGAPQAEKIVIQHWQYGFATYSTLQGRYAPPVTMEPNNRFGTAMLGGPLSMPPNYVWEAVDAGMNANTTIFGRRSLTEPSQFVFKIVGTAGGFLTGLMALEPFPFQAVIFATKIRQLAPAPPLAQ